MDDPSSPLTCPKTVTIRRNPPRRARPTPSATTAIPSNPLNISTFPFNDILSIDITNQTTTTAITTESDTVSLKVFLRVRPLSVAPKKTATSVVIKPNSKAKLPKIRNVPVTSCVVVNDLHSVTVTPPACDSSRLKSEVYTGFSRVFTADSSQDEVYDMMMRPIVEEFLNGRSGLLAALGPSGSGKTHTVFGSGKEPGLVPRALRHIFEVESGNNSMSSRSFYLSVFEISMEKSKGEKLFDLSPDGGDVHMQQSVVKGLKEVLIKDVAQAEAVLAGAKLKRATAMTNSNSQSSRSQCIINIRCMIDGAEGEGDSPLSGSGLTFVDLAGAEREKKTGNQGGRLVESNFINNTSMVFSLCLRSLLEHQKNPKKPLQKHFQSSLLTRYLRDYLEGRKRMALILTARSGPEDYFDASFLLRQASPYMEIKFQNVEETSKLPGNKRRNQAACNDKQKKVKRSNADEKDEVGRTTKDPSNLSKEDVSNEGKDDMLVRNSSTVAEESCPNAKLQREYNVLQGFAKASWNVLKEYKERVKGMEREIVLLTEKLSAGQDRYLAMEQEFHNLKSRCSCISSASEVSVSMELADFEQAVALECGKKPALFSSREQNPLSPDQKPLRVIAPKEQHKVSPFKYKAASFSQEKDDRDHFVGEIIETSSSEAGCKLDNIEIRLPRFEDPEGNFGLSVPKTLQNGSGEIQKLGATAVCEVHRGDSPSTTKTLELVDEKPEHDAILRTPFQETALPSLDFETSVQQHEQAHCPSMKCEISHDSVCTVDCHEKNLVEKIDKIATDATAHFPESHVMDLKIQRENNGGCTDEISDKENVPSSPQTNLNSKLEANETSHLKPLKSVRPKRRLMPASSLLLRDAGSLDVTDDSVKRKGGKGGQRLAEDDHKRTRGSASLLKLLTNHLPR